MLVASLVAATFLWEEEPKMERSFLSTGGTNQMRARQPPPHETSPPLVTLSSATMTRPDTPVQLPRAASPEQPRDGGGEQLRDCRDLSRRLLQILLPVVAAGQVERGAECVDGETWRSTRLHRLVSPCPTAHHDDASRPSL